MALIAAKKLSKMPGACFECGDASLKHSLINDRRLVSVWRGQKLVGSTESHKFSLEEAYRLEPASELFCGRLLTPQKPFRTPVTKAKQRG